MALTAFVGLVLLATFAERRILVPYALDRPPVDEVEYWEKHVERNERNAASRLRLGLAYAKVGQLDPADDSFSTALALKSDYDAAAIGRYGVVVRKHEPARALAELDDYARSHPSCAVCWQNLAAEYLSQKNLRAAEEAVLALLASDFSIDSKMYSVENMEVEASVLAGRVYAARGDYPRAIDFFRDSIARDPTDVRAYILQAKSLLASHEPGSARAVLEEASKRTDANERHQREIERLIRRARQVQR